MPTSTAVAPATPESKKKSFTNWSVFDKAARTPTEIVCEIYNGQNDRPLIPASPDAFCHSRLKLDGNQILDHINAGHPGLFQFTTRQADKPWPGWKILADSGLEIHDLRCAVCNRPVPVNVRHILEHCRPHRGAFRHSAADAGKFNFYFKFESPLASGDDADDTE
jgi:hypothetical protein